MAKFKIVVWDKALRRGRASGAKLHFLEINMPFFLRDSHIYKSMFRECYSIHYRIVVSQLCPFIFLLMFPTLYVICVHVLVSINMYDAPRVWWFMRRSRRVGVEVGGSGPPPLRFPK